MRILQLKEIKINLNNMIWTVILNKVMLMLFVLATLNVIRHLYLVLQIVLRPDDEIKEKYELSDNSLLILGVSIAYMITSIIL